MTAAGSPAGSPAGSTAHPLGRRFWTVWTGQTVSSLGSTLAGVGVAVHVYATTGSVAWLGVLLALSAVPSVAVVPVLGLVDRFDRRHVMIAADLVAALGPATALALALTGRLEIWHLALAGFLAGLGNALQFPAYQAAIPALVPASELGRANGAVQLAPALSVIGGPAAATVLLAAGGIEAVLTADLLSCGVGVAATAATRFRSRAVVAGHDGGDSPAEPIERVAGWTWLRTTGRPLLALVMVAAVINFGLAMFNVSLLAMATDLGGTARAGLAPTVGGLGMVVASILLTRFGVPQRRVRGLAVAIGTVGIGVIVTAVRPSYALVVVGVAVAMSAVPLAGAVISTLFHERVPSEYQGRVFGIRAAIGRALEPIGALVGGVVVSGVAGPIATSDGSAGRAVRAVLGDGPARPAALVAAVVGLTLVVVARAMVRSQRLAALDAPVDVQVAGPAVAANEPAGV